MYIYIHVYHVYIYTCISCMYVYIYIYICMYKIWGCGIVKSQSLQLVSVYGRFQDSFFIFKYLLHYKSLVDHQQLNVCL